MHICIKPKCLSWAKDKINQVEQHNVDLVFEVPPSLKATSVKNNETQPFLIFLLSPNAVLLKSTPNDSVACRATFGSSNSKLSFSV